MTVISQLTLMWAACSRQGRDQVQSCQVCWAQDLFWKQALSKAEQGCLAHVLPYRSVPMQQVVPLAALTCTTVIASPMTMAHTPTPHLEIHTSFSPEACMQPGQAVLS